MKNIIYSIDDNIANLIFDLKDEKVNKLSFEVLDELNSVLDEIKSDKSIKALLITSNKTNNFIAGADINEIKAFEDSDEIYNALIKGDDILTKIERLDIPTIAYIDGSCMGGGLELALSCKYILSSTNPKTQFAFPEIKLGFFPGLGGTQRFPKRVGLINALEFILSGKTFDSKKAFKINLVDTYFDAGQKEFKLKEFIDSILNKTYKRVVKKSFWERFSYTRNMIFEKALKNLEAKVNKEFIAPYIALKVIRDTYNKNFDEGIKIEARNFADVAVLKESKNLIEIFFTSEKLKKDYNKNIQKVEFATIIGSGVMGKGIIWLFSKYLHDVRVKVRKLDSVKDILQSVYSIYNYLIKTRKMTQNQVSFKMNKISYVDNYNGISKSDLVVEAIVEDLKQKTTTYKELEEIVTKDCIIATNTSSIRVELLSSELIHKDRFVGLHFFNPVNLMPLVEIIPTTHTSTQTIDRVKELMIRAGKTPIVVGDCAGFLVNRVLLPYMNEAGKILEEYSSIKEIDNTIKEFGMPMGPFTLADTVGIDIGYHVAKILYEEYGERMAISKLIEKTFLELKLTGKKTNKGFYVYSNKDIIVNKDIEKYIHSSKAISKNEIIDRCMLIMVNEASRCLEEHIVKDAPTLDFAMISGTGFPPYKGGILRFADDYKISRVVEKLQELEKKYGERFKPSKLLVELNHQNKTFYTGEELWQQ